MAWSIDTLVDIIRMNVRLPSRAMGDLRAQVTAVKTGERRFLQLLDRYGRKPVLDAIRAIMDQADAAARARTRTIPDGVYEAESFMDDDGIDIGKRVQIRVRVIVKGDEMTIDLTDISRQVRGFYNSGRRPRSAAPRWPTSASPRRPTIRSMTARSAASR